MPFPTLIVDNVTPIGAASINPIIAEHISWNDHRNCGGFNISNVGRVTLTGGAMLASASNRLGVNVATPTSMLQITGIDNTDVNTVGGSGVGGFFQISSGSGVVTDNKLMMGLVAGTGHTDSHAWIQAIKPGNAVRRLLLNPMTPPLPGYGSVGIATTGPYSQLSFGQLAIQATTAKPRFAFYEEPDGDYFRGIGLCNLGAGGFAMGIFCHLNASVPLDTEADLYVTDAGRVGVRKTNPGSNLAVSGLPTYANNSAALAGGLTAGDFYIASTGDPRPICIVI